jgi:hypothetical protein
MRVDVKEFGLSRKSTFLTRETGQIGAVARPSPPNWTHVSDCLAARGSLPVHRIASVSVYGNGQHVIRPDETMEVSSTRAFLS